MDIESHLEAAKYHTKKYAKIARNHIPEIVAVVALTTTVVFYKKYGSLRDQIIAANASFKDQEILTIAPDVLKGMIDNGALVYFNRADRNYGFVARAYKY